ncbi:MAG: hypothetical protein LLF75_07170 [Eubacteriales bacterium]|nr:hypothetical protein [Eubacteriales bacterium]
MKRLVKTVISFLMIFAFACAPAATGANTDSTAEATEAAAVTATPAPTTEPAPEPLGMAPIDLLGKGYNLFFDVVFPAGYTVYGAFFDSAQPKKGRNDLFALNLTAEGDRLEITRYCAELLGVTDEAMLAAYADAMTNDGYADITGTYAGKTAYAWLKQTDAGYESDQITDVEGCRIELAVDVTSEQAEQYRALVLANYSTAMLGDFADRFGEDTIRRDMLSIFVNVQKPDKTEVYVSHEVKDAVALLTEMTGTLQTSWYDEDTASFGLDYAMQRVKYSFDKENNIANVALSPNNNSAPAGKFKKSAVSFTSLGFTSYPNDGLCIYKEDQNHLEIAIAKPGWGHVEDWNFEFLGESNGCSLYMVYAEATGLFHIAVNKGDEGASAEYIVAENAFASDVYPDEETQKRLFSEAAGITEGDYRAAVFALFTDLVQDRFGMTWQELYALPIW